MSAFAEGHLEAAAGQLGAFQNKVRAQFGNSDPAAAQAFTAAVQQITDAVVCAADQVETARRGK
jgi:hypothetical protein